MADQDVPARSEIEPVVYDQDVGGDISLPAKVILERLVLEMKHRGLRGRQGAIVDLLIKFADRDPDIQEKLAAQLPEDRKRKR